MEPDTITLIGMWITVVGMILWQSYRHENSIKALDTKFDTKIDNKFDALNNKMDNKFDRIDDEFKAVRRDIAAQGQRLARIEGHLLGPRDPGDQGTDAGAPGEPPPEDR